MGEPMMPRPIQATLGRGVVLARVTSFEKLAG